MIIEHHRFIFTLTADVIVSKLADSLVVPSTYPGHLFTGLVNGNQTLERSVSTSVDELEAVVTHIVHLVAVFDGATEVVCDRTVGYSRWVVTQHGCQSETRYNISAVPVVVLDNKKRSVSNVCY